MTAGSCALSMIPRPWEYRVVTGRNNGNRRGRKSQTFEIVEIKLHPQFNRNALALDKNVDIALIRLYGKSRQPAVRLASTEVMNDKNKFVGKLIPTKMLRC